ncbi:MAG: metal ABC transporter permease [Pararhizobium sp.]
MSSLFAFEFMRNAYMASTIVALVCGVIGYFLVMRGEIFAGHALAHVAFPGATGAALIGVSPLAGALVFTIAAGLSISALGERAHRDIAIGLVLTLSLGLGILFLHLYTAYAGMATALLFGNVLAVSLSTVWVLAFLAAICLGVLAIIARPLAFSSLQPELAEAKGVPTGLLSGLFMAVTALAITQAIQIVGILLVFALLVAPAATAMRLTQTIRSGVLASCGLGLVTVWGGLALAFYTDAPTSFWITALGTGFYLASVALPRPGQAPAPVVQGGDTTA